LGGLKVGFCNRHTMRPAGWGADRSANANNYKDEKSETSVSLCHASAWLRRRQVAAFAAEGTMQAPAH
jgi:hypothetical protein